MRFSPDDAAVPAGLRPIYMLTAPDLPTAVMFFG